MFDVYYIGSNSSLKEVLPFAKQITSAKDVSPKTKMYWLIEPNIEVVDYDVFSHRPEMYDTKYEHVWKWDSNNYGGIRLIPKRTVDGVKQVNKIVCKKRFDILDTKTPDKYFDSNSYASHVWCVDKDYKLDSDINWAPGNFEPDYIHSFHLRGQLEHKYPAEEGGIKLFPREWKTADTKFHKFLDATVTYPILYVEDVNDMQQRDILEDEYVWLIDQQHKINVKTVDWVPDPFEGGMIHAFRMPYQLTEKYPMAMGGIRLVPKDWKEAEIKIHPACPVEDENYDVFYVDENEFTAEVFQEYAERSRTDWFWIVDRDFEFNGKLLYVPAEHEQEYIHVFKIPGHLDFRYPNDFTDPWDFRCGGVRLVNKDFDYTKHKYQPKVVPVRYDIFYIDNPSDFATILKKSRTKMFWSIDNEHTISQILNYVPTRDEQKYLLNFKVSNQLLHKYPQEEGGVYLVPTSYNSNTSKKYKGKLTFKSKEYPILFVDDVEDLSVVTEDCWLIDKEYQINDDIDWSPGSFEIRCQHTFHVPKQLTHKYPKEMGGVRWVPNDWNGEYIIHDDLPVKPKTYEIILVEDPNDYSQAIGECWLVDKEYLIDQDIEWLPSNFERDYIHTFHAEGQLEHKYPEAIGGIRWVPLDWENAETKIHTESPFTKPVFEKYSTEEEGREQTTKDWFWVIDSDVEVITDFDFSYVPTIWDSEKTHVWQKLHPKTNRQYDYAGVKLCPKVKQTTGRPKYIREPACVQIEYPVYHLQPADYKHGLYDVYERLAAQSNTDMLWIVDAYTQLQEDFNFDYYPTQWDKKNVHVFADEDGNFKNVRLVPKSALNKEYTNKEIANNSFEHLKQINTIASLKPIWPVIHLQSLERDEFVNAMKAIETPFVWTTDPDIKVNQDLLVKGFMPDLLDINKIHTWQKQNSRTDKVHAYGGLRLWPTDADYSTLTSDTLKFNKFRNLKYVKEVGSTSIPYEIFLISYKEDYNEVDKRLLKVVTKGIHHGWVTHIRGVKGIFEAHKACAEKCKTDMFWVIDADADVTDDFMFDYIPDVYDKEVVHVWASQNPVNGLEYGYGGVKLFPTEMVREADTWGIDFTTGLSNRFKSMPQISCVTKFNTDAFSTWRSAFRECVKLTLNDDAESQERLNTWLNTRGEEDFTAEAVKGALEGNQFAKANKNSLEELNKINDYEWLEQKWNQLN
ncbi:MAG: hypothetical protein CMO97_05505 [Woeseia sp.]|nr:hypothetical protein [Woeseia sp.]